MTKVQQRVYPDINVICITIVYMCCSTSADNCPINYKGSVLGPILFSLYINDLPVSVHDQVLTFADDTKLFSRIHRSNSARDISNMQHDIDS